MKKIIAIIVALAMVLSMSVVAFAAFYGKKSPADIAGDESSFNDAVNNPILHISTYTDIKDQGIYNTDDGVMYWSDAWLAYYAYVLENASFDQEDAINQIITMISEGYVGIGDAIGVAGETLMGGLGGDGESGDLSETIDGILSTLGSLFDSDAEPEVSAEEYAKEIAQMINDGAGIDEITGKIGDDIASGKIVISQLPEIADALSEMVELGEIEDNETVQEIIRFFEKLGGEGEDGGFQFPDFGDFTLPWDKDNSSSGSFLDTILGILGSIGDLLFGGSDDPSDPYDPYDPFEPFEPGDSEDPTNPTDPIPDTGDVSFIAVAAVAAVAGAALILTRKKNDDAE